MRNARYEYYLTVLELPHGASLQDVKTAYRELCLIWHPDKNPARVSERATKKLQLLNEAYQWLLQHGNLPDEPVSQTHLAQDRLADSSDRPHVGKSWWQHLDRVWQQIFQQVLGLTRPPDTNDVQRLLDLEQLDCGSMPIRDLTPVQSLKNLRKLACDNTRIPDLSPLRNVSGLQELVCWNTPITSLEPIAQLLQLQHLNCNATQIDSVWPLRNLVKLRQLSFSGTKVRSLEPLIRLKHLEHLSCGETLIDTLEPLQHLTQLRVLYCSQTSIASLAPLRHLPALHMLYCVDTQVSLYELGRFKTEFSGCKTFY